MERERRKLLGCRPVSLAALGRRTILVGAVCKQQPGEVVADLRDTRERPTGRTGHPTWPGAARRSLSHTRRLPTVRTRLGGPGTGGHQLEEASGGRLLFIDLPGGVGRPRVAGGPGR